MRQFDRVTIENVPRGEDKYADALANLTFVLTKPYYQIISVSVVFG